MKIVDIKVHFPLSLMRIITDEGIEGWCNGVSEEGARSIFHTYRKDLIGVDPLDREYIWQRLIYHDRVSYLPQALRGAVDVALWDIAGKAAGLPIHKLIGGFREKIPAYWNGGNSIEDALQVKEAGLFGYKDHFRDGPDKMIKFATELRAAVGEDMYLMHDAVFQNYTLDEALKVGRVLGKLNYHWFEEPLKDFDIIGLKKLSDNLDVPIVAPEYIGGSLYSTAQYLALQAVDTVRASATWRGGITDLLKIAHLAESFGVNCEITSHGPVWSFAHANAIASIRNCDFFEFGDRTAITTGKLQGEPIVTNPLTFQDGYVSVPTEPGLGIILDWDVVNDRTDKVLSCSQEE